MFDLQLVNHFHKSLAKSQVSLFKSQVNISHSVWVTKIKAQVQSCTIVCLDLFRKNTCSVTAFNSTDIRSVQDNVATPVTAMMVTVCISTDALSSVFISPDLSDTISVVGPSCLLQPVLTDCNSLFPTYLYYSVTSD